MILSDIQTRVLQRLGEDPLNPQFYQAQEVIARINQAQRIFVFITLCLENTVTINFPANAAYVDVLPMIPDMIVPLRVRAAGAKLKPSRLADLAALDQAWSVNFGPTQSRYALLGFGLMALYNPTIAVTPVQVTYANCPFTLTNPTDQPPIPEEYHGTLVNGAIPLCRLKEGAQELAKTADLWNGFIDDAKKLADFVRTRNKEQGYDFMPPEISRLDLSRMAAPSKEKSKAA